MLKVHLWEIVWLASIFKWDHKVCLDKALNTNITGIKIKALILTEVQVVETHKPNILQVLLRTLNYLSSPRLTHLVFKPTNPNKPMKLSKFVLGSDPF